jgi:hypothetical protein
MPDSQAYTDRPMYLKVAVLKQRHVIHQRLIDYKWGQCIIYDHNKCANILDLHRTDATQKQFVISTNGMKFYKDRQVYYCLRKLTS